jgi:predicted permease
MMLLLTLLIPVNAAVMIVDLVAAAVQDNPSLYTLWILGIQVTSSLTMIVILLS